MCLEYNHSSIRYTHDVLKGLSLRGSGPMFLDNIVPYGMCFEGTVISGNGPV